MTTNEIRTAAQAAYDAAFAAAWNARRRSARTLAPLVEASNQAAETLVAAIIADGDDATATAPQFGTVPTLLIVSWSPAWRRTN